jgi:hypothetical protein
MVFVLKLFEYHGDDRYEKSLEKLSTAKVDSYENLIYGMIQ